MATLAGKVDVELTDRRREAIRVGRCDHEPIRIARLDLIGQRRSKAIKMRGPHARGMNELTAVVQPARDMYDDMTSARTPGTHDRAAITVWVRAEQRVRVVVLARDEPVDVGGDAHDVTSLSSRRAMPATGIDTQSGRLLSS